MKRFRLFCCLLTACLFISTLANAQKAKIGVDATPPNASAAFEVSGTDGGMLFPRMTEAQRLAIAGGAPATGLVVYQTNEAKGIYIYNGTSWNILHQENIHGIVDTSGYYASAPPHIISTLVGGGYNATRLGVGEYSISFTSPFNKPPSTMVTAHNIGGIPPVPPPPTGNYCLPFFFASCQTDYNADQLEAMRLESHIDQSTVPVTEVLQNGIGFLPPNPFINWGLYITPGAGPTGFTPSNYNNDMFATSNCVNVGDACAANGLSPGNYSFHDPAFGACAGIYQGTGTPIRLSALPADSYELWMQSSRQWADAMGAWIDYNKDGDFNDPNECLYIAAPPWGECTNQGSGSTSVCGNPTYMGSFDVPATPGDALNGFTVFRALSSWTSMDCQDDCRIATWGETEDYFVEIINATPIVGDSIPPRPAHCNAFDVTTAGFKVNCTDLNGNLTDTKFHWEAEQQ